MAVEKWNEEGRSWEADQGLLTEEQIAQCARADEAETFRSPIPTRMVSIGEYMPVPQTKKQKQIPGIETENRADLGVVLHQPADLPEDVGHAGLAEQTVHGIVGAPRIRSTTS